MCPNSNFGDIGNAAEKKSFVYSPKNYLYMAKTGKCKKKTCK